ncbi:MAG: hypothetical protein HYY55_02735 [Candidatus Niyogibacteria bacterium]|nr:MAG: hypothetical protein HYY55_02735 [Candidatus Niyogibacteria bacterium]
MLKSNEFPNGQKEHLTYYKALFGYIVIGTIFIFLVSVGIAQTLLAWNTSVFVSTMLMFAVMVFYFRKTLKRSGFMGLEKDALDLVRKKLAETETEKLPDCHELIFETDAFFERYSATEFNGTSVVDYFRDLGKRIKAVGALAGKHKKEPVLTDELKFCFYANMERLIKPTVNGARKLLLFGFLGTVTGILLIGVGMQFGESAQQAQLIAKELIGGLGVAAITTILGLVGNLFLSSIYEQHEDIRDRILAELARLTSIYGLDLCSPPEPEEEMANG